MVDSLNGRIGARVQKNVEPEVEIDHVNATIRNHNMAERIVLKTESKKNLVTLNTVQVCSFVSYL